MRSFLSVRSFYKIYDYTSTECYELILYPEINGSPVPTLLWY